MVCKSCEQVSDTELCEACVAKLHLEAVKQRTDKFLSERRIITHLGDDYLFEAIYEIQGERGNPILIPVLEPRLIPRE